jgi:hypothetical protein
MGDIEDSISQCTLLQMTYTAENPPADGINTPGVRPRFRPPRRRDPHDMSPASTTTGCQEDKCPVVSKRPLHSRAELQQTMSLHIRIGPEPVLTAHVPSPPAANSAGIHCPAREDSAPYCGTEFRSSTDREENQVLKYWVRPSPAMGGLQIPAGLLVELAPVALEFWVQFPNERNQGKQGDTLCQGTWFVPVPPRVGSRSPLGWWWGLYQPSWSFGFDSQTRG